MDRLLFLVRRGVATLALLAIVVQVLLPATMLHARMDDGSLGHAAICRTDGATDPAPGEGPASDPAGTCLLCAGPAAVQAMVPTPPSGILPRPIATRIAWSVVALPAAPTTPPAAWPDSRAPPASA